MNIWNSTKLGEIPRLQEKWAELKLTPFMEKSPHFSVKFLFRFSFFDMVCNLKLEIIPYKLHNELLN